MNYNKKNKQAVQYTLAAPVTDTGVRVYETRPRFRLEKRRPASNVITTCFNCAENGHSMKQCGIYKVKMCKWWENGNCGYEKEDGTNTCLFSHGESEQRQAGIRCVQFIYDNGSITINGCRQMGHSYAQCNVSQMPVDENTLPKADENFNTTATDNATVN